MDDVRKDLSIEFVFRSELDSQDFNRWHLSHPQAETEQIIAHAKANGATKAILGDGTEWELKK